jgi:hypothetical protein
MDFQIFPIMACLDSYQSSKRDAAPLHSPVLPSCNISRWDISQFLMLQEEKSEKGDSTTLES